MLNSFIFRPKIILLGDAGSGKTSFISRISTPGMTKTYQKRLGVVIYKIPVKTSLGTIEFSFWDTCGQERFGSLRSGYFNRASGVILFFDLTNKNTYIHLPKWVQFTEATSGRIPIFVVGTKVDLTEKREVPVDKLFFPRRHNYNYFEISLVTNFNLEFFLNEFCKIFMDEPELAVLTPFQLLPPKEKPNEDEMKKCMDNLEQAKSIPPPTIASLQSKFGNMSKKMESENDLAKEIKA